MKSPPPSRPTRPRSASSGAPVAAPTSSAPKAKKSGAPSAPLSANERGVQRRAKKKTQARWRNSFALMALVCTTAIVVGMAAGIRSELKGVKSHVAAKQITLAALKAQLESGQKRLAAFTKGSGRERALAENGYVKPGERILLFPHKSGKTIKH